MIARDWRRVEKKTLQGYCSIETPSGLLIKEISVHQRDSDRWIGMPARSWTRPDGTTSYIPMVEFRDTAAKNAFQRQALEAIDVMLASSAEVVP